MLINFWVKRSKVKVTADNDSKSRVTTISLYLLEVISPQLSHVCAWAWDIIRSKGQRSRSQTAEA